MPDADDLHPPLYEFLGTLVKYSSSRGATAVKKARFTELYIAVLLNLAELFDIADLPIVNPLVLNAAAGGCTRASRVSGKLVTLRASSLGSHDHMIMRAYDLMII